MLQNNYRHHFRFFSALLLVLMAETAMAQMLSGRVTDADGKSLGFASVYIKGSTRGTTANQEGQYTLSLSAGKYTIVCAFVGYSKAEKTVEIKQGDVSLSFQLQPQQAELKEVVIRAGAEDPAYGIIRKAISRRKAHLEELKEWQVMVYMKGMIRTLAVPPRIFGMKIEPNRDVIDNNGKGIIYFSESLTRYSRRLPNDYKEEVVSAKLSGRSQGFGFNSPKDLEVNLYNNNIMLEGLSSRGFISPINDNALYYYRYKYEGTFYEDGNEITRIRVMPRRKYEPCFAGGVITIIEGSYRLHSVHLFLTRESQVQLVDSLELKQQMLPVGKGKWAPQQTQISAGFNVLGIRAQASFEAVFSDYDFDKNLKGVFSNKVIKVIDTSANKKTVGYWDSIRPMPLTEMERLDYLKKDTLEQKFKDPAYTDSLDKRNNRFRLMKVAVRGGTVINRQKKLQFSYPSVIQALQYNTVEGWVVNLAPAIRHWGDTGSYRIEPVLRYGFGNSRLQASLAVSRNLGKNYQKRWGMTLSGGRKILQINNENPIEPLVNTIGTLLYKVNYLKLYENGFGSINLRRTLNNGIKVNATVSYEDRNPLTNLTNASSWRKYPERKFSANYPEELPAGNFSRHQAFITNLAFTWQPGQKFIQYPNRRVSAGSTAPVFSLALARAWKNILGADASFSKWRVQMEDNFNLKLGGQVAYNAAMGGFINNDNLQLPDWQHFKGNQTPVASPYVSSFQLASYYANSTKAPFFASGHLEWHLNGLITNKIPLVRKWNWGLVTGSNAFYVDQRRNYFEGFIGIENIFKTLRLDWVVGYDGLNKASRNRIIIGLSGLFTGQGVQ